MIKTLVVLAVVVLAGCGDMCTAGKMRCHNGVAQMCNSEDHWESWQDCNSVGLLCSTAPSECSGFTGIACCY